MTAPRTGQQTVVSPPTGQTYQAGRTPQIERAPSPPLPIRFRATPEALGNPEQVARLLNHLHDRVDEVGRSALTNVLAGAVLVRSVQLVGGTSKAIEHRLGRAYTGWVVSRMQSNSAAPAPVIEVALGTGEQATRFVRLKSNGDCSFDLLVF